MRLGSVERVGELESCLPRAFAERRFGPSQFSSHMPSHIQGNTLGGEKREPVNVSIPLSELGQLHGAASIVSRLSAQARRLTSSQGSDVRKLAENCLTQ